jgi:CheY-like chemotaxis protein
VKRIILLADDSATIQRLVTQTFADSNVEIVSVSNGDAAIRKFEEIRPNLVLSDIYMPGKNGYEVCAYIKNHSQLAATPVVLLAGAFDAFDEGTAQQAGAAAHITKPFEPQALVDLVMGLLPKDVGNAVMPAPPKKAAAKAAPAPASGPAPKPAAPAPPAPAPAPAPTAEPKAAQPPPPVSAADHADDLLGLDDLFEPPVVEATPALSITEEEIERIADRVIQKLSTQVIESVAWDVVPGITTKVLREELKRQS